MINFFDIKNIHFVGVGGVSMSKLCFYCLNRGIKCSGSDCVESENLSKLKSMGANVYVGENKDVAALADLVVFTSAINLKHSELLSAKTAIERKYFLALFADTCEKVAAISGSHGKTTVTSMVSWILYCAKKKFIGHIGGEMVLLDALSLDTGNEIFVTEACEYNRSFLELKPDIGVVLNVDFDHPDCYESLEDTYIAFSEFVCNTKSRCVINYEDAMLLASAKGINALPEIITFGDSLHGDYYLTNTQQFNGVFSFDVYKKGNYFASFRLNSYNAINMQCALASIIVCELLGVELKDIQKGIQTFMGVKRRFECLGLLKGKVKVISDYAHHPCEIENAIINGRKLAKDRLVVVFEPHTYSRTKALMKEFVNCFKYADECLVIPTFSAREIPSMGATAYELFQEMKTNNLNVKYFNNQNDIELYLQDNYYENDVILLVGAGAFPIFAEKNFDFRKKDQ